MSEMELDGRLIANRNRLVTLRSRAERKLAWMKCVLRLID
jgi:hypothetical protein